MNRKMGARLPCRVLKEEVRKMKPTRPVRKIADAPAVSLASVLACLTVEIKLGLSYILARSLWEFYASDVIQTELSTQTVHFMRARSDQEPSLYVQRPCLFLQAASPDSAFVEYNDDGVSLHHHPKVLALGVMMVEIGMGSLIQSAGENINSTYLSALEATQTQLNSSLTTKRERLEREKPMPAYWKIVEDCLDTELFENDDSEFDPRDSIRLEKRQRILYDRVVLPLEKLLRGTAYFDRLEKLESLPYQYVQEEGRAISNHTDVLSRAVTSAKESRTMPANESTTLQVYGHTWTKSLSWGQTARLCCIMPRLCCIMPPQSAVVSPRNTNPVLISMMTVSLETLVMISKSWLPCSQFDSYTVTGSPKHGFQNFGRPMSLFVAT